jgi:hypothetical protein
MSSPTKRRSLSCLRPYQQEAVTHLYEHDAALLLLRMGGGKTVITLAAVAELYRDGHITSALVVAPKAVADNTWRHELREWDIDLTVAVALGTAHQRLAALRSDAAIKVVTYDNLQWLARVMPDAQWDLIVMDEITRFNSGGKRYKAFRPYLQRAAIRWGLTGSFVANNLMAAFYPVQAVDLGRTLGRTIGPFRQRFFWKGQYEYHPLPGAAEGIAGLVAPLCYQPDPAVYQSQLPEVVYLEHEYELEGDTYTKLREDLAVEIDGQYITVAHAGALGNKLAQAASGFLYDGGRVDDTRLRLLDELVAAAAGESVLVWYWFQESADALRARGWPDLLDCLDAWNAGRVPVAICHPRSGGHGVNAQHGGSRMIWFEGTWSAEERAQAEARLHRQGQTRTVFVHDLLALENGRPTIDHAMKAKREGKMSLADAVAKSLGVACPEEALA